MFFDDETESRLRREESARSSMDALRADVLGLIREAYYCQCEVPYSGAQFVEASPRCEKCRKLIGRRF